MKGYKVRFLALLAILALATSMMPASAAGVTITASVPSNGEINSADVGATGFATTTITWTGSATYVAGQQIQLVFSPAPSSTSIAPCVVDTSSVGGAAPTWSSASASGVTFTVAGVPANASVTLCMRVPVSNGGTLTPRNYSVAALTTGATVDYGAVLFYVNGGNDVDVSATVPSTLSFIIASSTSLTTEKHDCQLGTLTTGGVSSCDYRLRISTNAASGFTATMQSSQRLANGTHTATITDIGYAGTVTAGTEGYGVAVTGASAGGRNPSTGLFDQPVTVNSAFATNDNPVATTSHTIVSYTGGFISTTQAESSLVTHKAAINGATPAGAYSQKVTYYVTGTF